MLVHRPIITNGIGMQTIGIYATMTI